MTEYGTDISGWNTVTDWNAVRANGISFVSIKVTESTGYVSPDVAAQTNGARNAGIVPGGYHFARNDSTPEAQARFFAAECSAHALLLNGSFVPMLDMEATELASTADDFTRRFITAFRVYSGQSTVAVYSNLEWFQNILHPDQWADDNVFLWIAVWNGDPGNPGWAHPRLALHQHTDAGTVPGLAGTVDRDATVAPFTVAQLCVGNTHLLPQDTPPTQGDTMFQFVCNTDGGLIDPSKPFDGTTNGYKVVSLLLGGGLMVAATWADVHAKDHAYGGDGTGSVLGVGATEYQEFTSTDAAVRTALAALGGLGSGTSGAATKQDVTDVVSNAIGQLHSSTVYHLGG